MVKLTTPIPTGGPVPEVFPKALAILAADAAWRSECLSAHNSQTCDMILTKARVE
jgi:hypothetical protein